MASARREQPRADADAVGFLLDWRRMDWNAIALSLRLAAVVSVVLLAIGLPIAYWLTFSSWRWKFLVEAVVALPLVLPPTVLGFYVLVALGSRSPIGRAWTSWTGHGLAFTFEALVIASILYSLPFAVQPIAASFAQIDRTLLEASAILGAGRWRTFLRVLAPLAVDGIIAGAVLTFAHTMGEFGVVLMVGGNLPGITRTVSIAIYDDVQSLNFAGAQQTSLVLLLISFAALALVYGVTRKPWAGASVS
jgi:molybdate transport system permease protein